MKAALGLFIAALLGAGQCLAQRAQIDFDKLHLNGLPFTATKAQVIRRLGKPTKTDEPHYECGALSSQEQGKRIYSLHYANALFTGNSQEGYVMDQVMFSAKKPIVLLYGTWKLTEKTTLKDLEKAFGHSLKMETMVTETSNAAPVVSLSSKGDDGAIFWFEKGRLVKFEYWTPC